jgi:DNA-directed RNA polymerase subunit RPC12/RpoP
MRIGECICGAKLPIPWLSPMNPDNQTAEITCIRCGRKYIVSTRTNRGRRSSLNL